MTRQPEPSASDRAIGDLLAELTGVATHPAYTDPERLRRLNDAFGRVRDAAPDAYYSDPSVAGFHFQADYFANDTDQLDLFDLGGGG